jgi:16S rRNA (cytidine1402-2'-O)-methyltransferase
VADQGTLIVVATPIGNLEDMSPRAAAALRDADVIACEDTRRTATLLRHVGSSAPMVASHEHNEAARAQDLVGRMQGGATVAVVSDAGMPVVSDPGARVVVAAIAAGIDVTVIPGPSAVETALVMSGFPAEPFVFVGFFPRKTAQRHELFATWAEFSGSVVGFESPHRVADLLTDLAAVDPDRPVAVCRELTKLYEEVLRGTASDLAPRMREGVRGEVTIVIGPGAAEPQATDTDHVVAVLTDAGLSPKSVADVAAKLGLVARNDAYRAALAAAKRNST